MQRPMAASCISIHINVLTLKDAYIENKAQMVLKDVQHARKHRLCIPIVNHQLRQEAHIMKETTHAAHLEPNPE